MLKTGELQPDNRNFGVFSPDTWKELASRGPTHSHKGNEKKKKFFFLVDHCPHSEPPEELNHGNRESETNSH